MLPPLLSTLRHADAAMPMLRRHAAMRDATAPPFTLRAPAPRMMRIIFGARYSVGLFPLMPFRFASLFAAR